VKPVSFPAWLRATWLGWVLGVPCVALLALAGEAAGIGGSQFLVGLGMGAGVGILQGRALRPLHVSPLHWALASAVGLALPFLASDLAARRGWAISYSLFWCVVTGGVIVGLWQAMLLRARALGAGWWVAGSAAGWTLAAAVATAADVLGRTRALRGLAGAAAYLGIVAAGGLVLGLATAAALGRITPRVPAS
jgi:hypothetical protein